MYVIQPYTYTMKVKKWSFVNFSGLESPTHALEPTTEIIWLPHSNQILIEGVFSTGDENHQVSLRNIVQKSDEEIEVRVGVNKIDAEFVADIGRYVPYEVRVELSRSFPKRVRVIHENSNREEIVRKEVENPTQ